SSEFVVEVRAAGELGVVGGDAGPAPGQFPLAGVEGDAGVPPEDLAPAGPVPAAAGGGGRHQAGGGGAGVIPGGEADDDGPEEHGDPAEDDEAAGAVAGLAELAGDPGRAGRGALVL